MQRKIFVFYGRSLLEIKLF